MGNAVVRQVTAKDRLARSLKAFNEQCRLMRHWPLPTQHDRLCQMLKGHYGYFGISGNSRRLEHGALSCAAALALLYHPPPPRPGVDDEKSDGMYPLVTNDRTLTPQQVLEAHKGQPRLKKRFEQLKTVHEIAPVFLKNPARIERELRGVPVSDFRG